MLGNILNLAFLEGKLPEKCPPRYDRRFCAEFLLQLQERNWPHYPDRPWWTALKRAAEIQPCDQPAPIGGGSPLRNDERSWKAGVPQSYIQEGTRWWTYSICKACDKFLASHGA